MLLQLQKNLIKSDAVMIMDDSPKPICDEIDRLCNHAMDSSPASYYFVNHQGKSGRGSAIRRGMANALNLFPNLEYMVECDADGSHRPEDILRIKNSEDQSDLLVGSRYLSSSKIVGWPLSRRIFSRILNFAIPKILDVPLADITNGLRRYTIRAVREILSEHQTNTGFIYLSEQAQIVKRKNLQITELPIEFIDRTLGKSTVTWREITASIRGIFGLMNRSDRK
jgi:dolichol-phosphate mannosyltransferase